MTIPLRAPLRGWAAKRRPVSIATSPEAFYRQIRQDGESREKAIEKVAHAYGRHWAAEEGWAPDRLREEEARLVAAGEVSTDERSA